MARLESIEGTYVVTIHDQTYGQCKSPPYSLLVPHQSLLDCQFVIVHVGLLGLSYKLESLRGRLENVYSRVGGGHRGHRADCVFDKDLQSGRWQL